MIRLSAQAAIMALLTMTLAGCALWPFGGDGDEHGAFGDPQEARLLLSRAEAEYATSPIAERGDAWREAGCEAEGKAREALQEQLVQNLKAGWARAELRSGNDLPSLRQRDLDAMVSDIMPKAKIVTRGDPEYGVTEVFVGVELSGRLSQCLTVAKAKEAGALCAQPPRLDPKPTCDELSPPELLYYLEDA